MTTSNSQAEVRHALRTIEMHLAEGMSVYELAAILQHELRTCPNLTQLFQRT